MAYRARIIKDSTAPDGTRLTTFEVTFPRFILAEFNTHRVFSRNSASSRAIPIKKQIKGVLDHPYVPEEFGSTKKGMSGGPALTGWRDFVARRLWRLSRYAAVGVVKLLDKIGVHKSWANRLLEPWMWHTVIVTSTEWSNFFSLRTEENAQPEIRKIASMMQKLYNESIPKNLKEGQWHLPLVSKEEKSEFNPIDCALISAGRCAKSSYATQGNYEDPNQSIQRAELLSQNGHWSPFEHQAIVTKSEFDGGYSNFIGQWQQFRKTYVYEHDFTLLRATK